MTHTVTLGLNTYNAADTVAAALDSVLAQDYEPSEILVVDDASSDGTRQIVESYAAKDHRVRLLVNDANSGLAASRNVIIREARGEFICFFDDDDVSRSDRVRRQLDRLIAYEQEFAGGRPVACHAARLQNYDDGTTRIERTMGEDEGRPAPSGPAATRRVLAGTALEGAYGSCAGCSQMARTATFRDLGGFDPAFRRGEDTDFFVRMARAGGHFVGIAEPLVVQTMTRGSDKGLEREREYRLALIDKHRDFFDSDAQYRFCRDWIEMKHSWLSARRGDFARRLFGLGLRHPARTVRRLAAALPNLEGNRAFGRFHRQGGS